MSTPYQNPMPHMPHDPYGTFPQPGPKDRNARAVAGVAIAAAALSIFLSFQVRADRAELVDADTRADERIAVLEQRVATLEGSVAALAAAPADGAPVDTDGDGIADGIDTDGDGIADGIDTDGGPGDDIDVGGLVEQGAEAGTVVRDLLARLAGTLENLLTRDTP